MKKVSLLDCTLRDGAYIVDAKFGRSAIVGIIKRMQEAHVDIIECGWLKNNEHTEGTTFYHVPDDLKQYIGKKDPNSIYAVMIDWDRYDLNYLPECDGKTIDAIRVVFPYGKHKEGIAVGKAIREKGYKVLFQAANTLAYKDEDLIDLANEINKVDAEALSVVDTFGAMYEEDLIRIVKVLDEHLRKDIMMGIHSHNNQQLSFALSMKFVNLLKDSERNIMVDASLCGMGRGAGNATTELVASFLNKKCNCNYDMNVIMDAIDTYMAYFKENYTWGYSTPYFIAGMYCCHVNNIAYLLKNHRTNAQDMRNIIESLEPDDRKKYDYDLLERKYLENQSRIVDDENARHELKEAIGERPVLLIAPGTTSTTEADKIKTVIKNKNAIVIGVNAINSLYNYDYLFMMNKIRYDYAKDIYPEKFEDTRKILLSNVKSTADDNEIIINFNRVIKRGWEHFDNAVINCLRLLDSLGVSNVLIAGFDGFKHKYNESYADEALPTLNPNNDWDSLNKEIKDMFNDFVTTKNTKMDIEFVTESIFED